jgi:hypothetical protein
VVSADGSGVVRHAEARLLADLADATGLTNGHSTALRPLKPRGTGHDPGRIMTDLAVMLADGGETITDLAVLRDQAEVFGPVASTPTAWRLLAGTNERRLVRLRTARAAAREVAWLQATETGEGIPAARAGGRALPGLVLDIDATLVALPLPKTHPSWWEPCAGSGASRRWLMAPRPSRGERSPRHDDPPCCCDWPTSV